MPRWIKVARAMVGTGLTFALGVGATSAVVAVAAKVAGALSGHDVAAIVSRMTLASFIVGVAFSGALALVARRRSFDKLSLPFVTALGAGGGLLYFIAIGLNNGFRVWTPSTAVANFVLLLLIGSGAAAATLVVARRAKQALGAGEETRSLGEGAFSSTVEQRESEREARL